LPLLLFAYATTRIQKSGLYVAEQQLEVSVIDHVATVLDRDLFEVSEATHRVGRILTEGSIDSDDARLELAREALARATALSSVTVYDDKGQLVDAITRTGATVAKPPAKLAEKAPETDAAGTWELPEYGPEGPILRFVEPVFRKGELRAWVVGTLRADALAATLSTISRDRFDGRADGVLLLDRDARVFAGGGSEFPIGSGFAGRDVLSTMSPGAFDTGFAFAKEYVSQKGEPMVGAVRSIQTRGWAVVVRRPASAVYLALAEARKMLLLAAGGFVLVAIVIGTVLANRALHPIRRLVELARAYGARKFSTRSDVHSGDELEDLASSMVDMADAISSSETEILRRAGVEKDLSRYLPAEVAKSIASGEKALTLGGERRAITIVFADVVAFTPFAESAPPEKVVSFLNELFTVLTEVVFRHGGIVDKFVGDSVMAVFGAPNEQSDHAARALAAAEDMHRFVEASAPSWSETYGFDVKLAIGVSSGEAVVGNLGSETRMEYTAIGDVVNVAARLEALARPGQTLVTEATVSGAGADFSFAPLGEQPIRGKRAAVLVSELL
jgi:class 3 adenylate cyclase